MPKVITEDEKRVKLNCLIAPATRTAIAGLQVEHKESQGEIVDRAILLLAYGEEIAPVRLISGESKDVTPESWKSDPPPEPVKGTIMVEARDGKTSATVNVTSDLNAVGPEASCGRGKATVQTFRRGIRLKGDAKR